MDLSRSQSGRAALPEGCSSPMALSSSASNLGIVSPQRNETLAKSASTPTIRKMRPALALAGDMMQRSTAPGLKSPSEAKDMSPKGKAVQRWQKARTHINAVNAVTLPATLKGRHMLLAKSLAENVPAKVVKELALDPDFAFRDHVVDAMSRTRGRATPTSSLRTSVGGSPRLRTPTSNKHVRLSGASFFEDSHIETESPKELDSKGFAARPLDSVEISEEERRHYEDCTQIGHLYRQGAVTLLKGQWLVDFSESIKLEITVVSAKNLKNLDFGSDMDKSDPYVVVQIPAKPHTQWRSKTIWDNLNPVWNQKFEMNTFVAGDSLEFVVYDDDGGKDDAVLGSILVRGEAFVPNGFSGELQLGDKGKHGVSYISVKIELPKNAINRLPRRQDLPAGATWDANELFDGTRLRTSFEIVAVSHTWLSPKHPDPDGAHLQRLGQFLKAWAAVQSGLLLTRVAVFFDWCSLPQEPRSQEDKHLYDLALRFVGIWFANQAVNVFLLTNDSFYSRGWPTFESALAGLNLYRGGRVFDLGCLENVSVLPTDAIDTRLISTCVPSRAPFLAPKPFELQLQHKKFSVEEDYEVVLNAYSDAFYAFAASERLKSLDLSGLSWGTIEIEAIVDALQFFTWLQELNFHDNLISDDGAAVLADIVPLCKNLHTLVLTSNEIEEGGAGADRLEASWAAAGKVRRLLFLDF